MVMVVRGGYAAADAANRWSSEAYLGGRRGRTRGSFGQWGGISDKFLGVIRNKNVYEKYIFLFNTTETSIIPDNFIELKRYNFVERSKIVIIEYYFSTVEVYKPVFEGGGGLPRPPEPLPVNPPPCLGVENPPEIVCCFKYYPYGIIIQLEHYSFLA